MLPPVSTLCKNTLIVSLAVIPPEGGNADPQVLCPPLLVPKGAWTIVWNLVTLHAPQKEGDPPPPIATFPEELGICQLFGSGKKFMVTRRLSLTQWAASLDNDTEKSAEALGYEIRFEYSGKNEPYRSTNREVFRHDPTIVVSKDPIEPPPTGGQG